MSDFRRTITYEFEDFRLDAHNLLLFRGSEQLDLPPKAVELLLALVRHNGTVISKDELMQIVWPATIVDDSNISQHLYLLRKTLGSDKNGNPFIETLRRRGYRFSAELRTVAGSTSTTSGAEQELSGIDRFPSASPDAIPLMFAKTDRQFSDATLAVWIAILFCIFVTGIASIFYRPWSSSISGSRELPGSIAVLPFSSVDGGDGSSSRLGMQICDVLITKLGSDRRVAVRPTSAVQRYTSPERDVVEIGRIQGVDAVLDGRIQHEGDGVRITVQLVDSLNGETLWSSQFDARDTRAFEIQDMVSDRVLSEMFAGLAAP